jgi:hypothetical protein
VTCPCGFPSVGCEFDGEHVVGFSAEWHRLHKAEHLRVFPNIASDRGTVRNLDEAIERAERAEASA